MATKRAVTWIGTITDHDGHHYYYPVHASTAPAASKKVASAARMEGRDYRGITVRRENPGKAARADRGAVEHAHRQAGRPRAAVDASRRAYQIGGYRSRAGAGYYRQKHWENHRRQKNPGLPGIVKLGLLVAGVVLVAKHLDGGAPQ